MNCDKMIETLLVITSFTVFLLILWPNHSDAGNNADPWLKLRRSFPVVKTSLLLPQTKKRGFIDNDPWQRLRHVVIPFSIDAEQLLIEREGAVISSPIKKKLSTWQKEIENAAIFFQIPTAIIEAVIMVESGGNPKAKAHSSSASGLMQTIKATFSEARRALAAKGVIIPDDPFAPYASIMAGSWYLDKMFEQAKADGKAGVKTRSDLASWRYPLEYYYAGPGHGRKAEPRVLVYSGGKRLMIDKPAYSKKVLSWASKLS